VSRRSAIKRPGFEKTRWLFERSRIIDSDGEMLGRLRCRGDRAHPIRRLQLLPRPLWSDRYHARPEREGLRPVRSHDVLHRGAVDDLDDLVAIRVARPGAFAGKFASEDGAVAVRRQSCEGPLPLGRGRLRGTPAQRRQLGQLGLKSMMVSTFSSARL